MQQFAAGLLVRVERAGLELVVSEGRQRAGGVGRGLYNPQRTQLARSTADQDADKDQAAPKMTEPPINMGRAPKLVE